MTDKEAKTMTFEEVWNELKAKDTSGVFAKAEELSLVSIEAIEYAFNSGYNEAKKQFERPKGEWITQEGYDGDEYYECSVCKDAFMLMEGTSKENNYNFCPNCGADMRGEEV